jgi:hypothetical protein
MPLSKSEQQCHQDFVMRFWQKTLKHRDRAL